MLFYIYLFFNLFIEGIVSSTLFSVTFQNRAVRVLAAVKCRDKSNEKKKNVSIKYLKYDQVSHIFSYFSPAYDECSVSDGIEIRVDMYGG